VEERATVVGHLESDRFLADASLIDDLLAGRTERGHELLRRAGVDPDVPSQVGAVRADDPDDLERLGAAVGALLRTARAPALIAIWLDGLVIVASAGVSLRELLQRARPALSFRGGVGLTFTGADSLPGAYREARQALAMAGPGEVFCLREVTMFDYVLRLASGTAERLVPTKVRTLDHVYRRTLEVFAECDLNAELAARRLHVHPNTVRYRLRRIEEITGRDVRRFPDVVELLLCVHLLESARQ